MTFLITTWADGFSSGPHVMRHRVDADTELTARTKAYQAHRLAVTPSTCPEITVHDCEALA